MTTYRTNAQNVGFGFKSFNVTVQMLFPI